MRPFAPPSRAFDLRSASGKRYAISVSPPSAAPPVQGHPVLLVVDGDSYFASVSAAARNYQASQSAVIVGIGYPTDLRWARRTLRLRSPTPPWLEALGIRRAAVALERLYDLTLPSSSEALAEEMLPGIGRRQPKDVGGVDAFLSMIEQDLIPKLTALLPIDERGVSMFGHSLGGLAVLHALFTRTASFGTFIASSPSIWWGRRAVLDKAEEFEARLRNSHRLPRVLITVGACEGSNSRLADKLGVSRGAVKAIDRNHRMAKNAEELATRLRRSADGRLERYVDFVQFEGLGHELAAWSAMARGITYCFG